MVDPRIFEQLQANVDDDAHVREELRNILQKLERQGMLALVDSHGSLADGSVGRLTQSLLARAHSTPAAELEIELTPAWLSIVDQLITIKELEEAASRQNYYRYNQIWTKEVQNTIMSLVFCNWLGAGGQPQGSLLTIDQVASVLNVPANVKDRDTFHITTEEYLQALISLIEELARLAVNSVTLGDYHRPLQISKFVKDLHAGFQILNLKNDSLRRRTDSIKYNVGNLI
ncbi:MAG: hypothetical protein Q9219_000765 [cf. Caloplaca sp. 3 TL-2023]